MGKPESRRKRAVCQVRGLVRYARVLQTQANWAQVVLAPEIVQVEVFELSLDYKLFR